MEGFPVFLTKVWIWNYDGGTVRGEANLCRSEPLPPVDTSTTCIGLDAVAVVVDPGQLTGPQQSARVAGSYRREKS